MYLSDVQHAILNHDHKNGSEVDEGSVYSHLIASGPAAKHDRELPR